MHVHRFLLAGLATCSLLAAACSAPPPPAERDIFSEANDSFEGRHFTDAVIGYEELLEQFPFSDLAEVARLKIAHAYYLHHEYEKAVAAFNDFERLHPTSPMLPFVEYTIGMSYLDQATSRDRDKSSSENALRQFERVYERYPDSAYGRLAGFRISECKENLASHELYVGDFYVRTGKTEAGRLRYEFVLHEYPETHAARQASRRLAALAG